MKRIIKISELILLSTVFLLSISGCKKYLDEKSDKKLLVPSTLDELQSLLDNYSTMNTNFCAGGETSSDDFYLTDADWSSLYYDWDKRMYIWDKENLFSPGSDGNDWYYTYSANYASASVLEKIQTIPRTPSNYGKWNDIKGQALLFRACRLLDAAFVWTLAYDSNTAVKDLGLTLRLCTDFNVPSTRASVQQTYDQIINDAKASIPLLTTTPLTTFRPSKQAAYGILARAYLSMRDYESAGRYADSSLQISNELIDYNTLSFTDDYPVKNPNKEALFYTIMSVTNPLYGNTPKVNPSLYSSYSDNDLRKIIFFSDNGDGTYSFKGNYTGDYSLFSGIATDEMYLIRSECYARNGNTADALADLNALLINRWKTGTFVPFVAANSTDALNLILQERNKELLMRGLRWMDIKRLNKEGAKITLTRNVEGNTYTLPPNDLRYALPIPEEVISLTGMPQNIR